MIRIAIVDDSKGYIDIIKRKIANIMEETGYCQYDISEFTDGSMFLKDNSSYDVLLLDIDMPQMNGFEELLSYTSQVTIIMCLSQ